MGKPRAELDKEKYDRLKRQANQEKGLIGALCNYACNHYGGNAFSNLWEQLTAVYGKAPSELKTVEEFWNPALKKAVISLEGEKFQTDMEEITRMRMEGQFSSSMWRRSYRSADFGYHASWAVSELCGCIYFSCYKQNVKELLYCEHEWLRGYGAMLALELRRGNQEVISLVRDAMLGDGGEVLLSSKIIEAVIISGNSELIELLIKLLLAARLQEGLRQQILEHADSGSAETLTRILKVCIDEDMFRYSSATRAFDTWTGLGYGDAKSAVVKKCAACAYECLTDEQARKRYLDSENNLEIYFALWGMGCHEVADTDAMVSRLMTDQRKYRRVLGWLFVSRTDSSRYRMRMAERYLEERDDELLAWVISNLSVTSELLSAYRYQNREYKTVVNTDFPKNPEERKRLFYRLKEVCLFIGNRNRAFTGNPFAFTSITLENTRVLSCMMSLAGYDMDEQMVDELVGLLPYMNVDQRRAFYLNFLQPEKKEKHRKYLREALHDRAVQVKELAVGRLSKCTPGEEELEALSQSLRSKSSSLRKSVLTIFREQKPEKLSSVIENMLSSGEEYQIQAGIELLLGFKDEHPETVNLQRERLEALKKGKLTTQTSILLDQLENGGKQESVYTEENGFGLYDPGLVTEVMEMPGTEEAKAPDGELEKLILPQAEYEGILERMNQVFERHKDYEYEIENYDGSHTKILFGDASRNSLPIPAEFGRENQLKALGKTRLEMIPFHEEFAEAIGVFTMDVTYMLGLCYLAARWRNPWMHDMEIQDWFGKILGRGLAETYHNQGYARFGTRYWQMMDIIALIPQSFDAHQVFVQAMNIYRSMVRLIGEGNLGRNYLQKKKTGATVYYYGGREEFPINHRMIGYWRVILKNTAVLPEDFKIWFLTENRLEHLAKAGVEQGLRLEDYFRACDEELIPRDALYERLLMGSNAEGDVRCLTDTAWQRGRGRVILDKYPWAEKFTEALTHRIVEVEAKRGELPTPLTRVARAIGRFEGAEYFCNLLAALGKEKFFRGYEYSSDTTKRAVLSRLLKRCYPAKEDTAGRLKEYLKKTDIGDKRLTEAVMYAPQWAAFAEQILGWPGLKCGVWFFHAHINETFSAEKETEVALYSPITPRQFNDGAFDKDWFFLAYSQLGEKRFQILYNSAKYITSGSNQHRRSQLYTDAVLGRLNAEELKAEIIEKRNQEKLRCYPLIPLGEGGTEEALRRYEFIQRFLKESKQFGSQRRESEKKACGTALENLAITTGFMDVNRMAWYLESEKLEEIRPLMEPQELEGVKVWLEIGEDGMSDLAVEKNGKRQKSLPKALNKHETVLTLKETAKELKEQRRRARESLEKAMVDSTVFKADELRKISTNPVLSPLVMALVWTDGARNGMFEGTGEELSLRDIHGQIHTVAEGGEYRVAHPCDLIRAGEWAEYMHDLYERKLVQPFKQVFREYYGLTEDERQEKTVSRRYAGHQVQPQKTVALLKGRGWTVDYEEGLQKVYYKENLIVRMYALADWFSPADIEAPTLETIHFFDRNTGECVELEKVPPILFSEAMRDMDLVVSVAHVGGVDPEASHSTVEMRAAIAAELVRLLKLSNVTFIGSHAKIQGTLANYSVHMGSGVVHGEAIGMIAILPVHSQARGRIFLPFADEDPKTAEIMSKIILLAEDRKIKDPGILAQIRQRAQ